MKGMDEDEQRAVLEAAADAAKQHLNTGPLAFEPKDALTRGGALMGLDGWKLWLRIEAGTGQGYLQNKALTASVMYSGAGFTMFSLKWSLPLPAHEWAPLYLIKQLAEAIQEVPVEPWKGPRHMDPTETFQPLPADYPVQVRALFGATQGSIAEWKQSTYRLFYLERTLRLWKLEFHECLKLDQLQKQGEALPKSGNPFSSVAVFAEDNPWPNVISLSAPWNSAVCRVSMEVVAGIFNIMCDAYPPEVYRGGA